MKLSELAEALLIFAKYDDNQYAFSAEHDEIWASLTNPEKMRDVDKNRLEKLGWSFEENMGWSRFV